MANKIELILQLLDQSGPGFKAVEGHIRDLRTRGNDLASTFLNLKSIIIGLVTAAGFKKVGDEVFSYNKTLESSRLGVAAIITSTAELRDEQGRVLEGAEKFQGAQKLAILAQQELRREGMLTAATYKELVEIYQGILAPALSAKMSFQQTLEIASLLTNSVKSIGLATNQVKQEARDLIQGGIQAASSSLAVALGINDAMVKKWREQGTLYDELKKRLIGFRLASAEFGNTWEGIWSNFTDVVQMALGERGKGIFEATKSLLKDITERLVDIKRDGKGIVIDIKLKEDIKEKLDAIAWALKNIAKAAIGVAAAFDITGTAAGEYIGVIQERGKALVKDPLGLFSKKHYENIPGMDQTNDKLQLYSDLLEKIGNIGKEKPEEAPKNVPSISGKPAPPDEAKVKKIADATDKLQAQMYEMQGLEEKVIDLQAKRYRDEGIDKHLVNQWQDLRYKKLQYEEDSKLAKAREEWTKADLEREQAYIEIRRSAAEVDAEIGTRRDRLAVDRGELTIAEAVNREYERRVAYLAEARDRLQELLNGMGIEVEYSSEAQGISQKMIALQTELNKLAKEHGIIIEENADAWHRRDLELKIRNAATPEDAVAAKWQLMVAEAKTSGQQIADAFEKTFEDIKASLSDLIMDSVNGFKNWASIVTKLCNQVLKRWIDMQVDAMMGKSGGFLGGSLLGLFGGSSGARGSVDMTAGIDRFAGSEADWLTNFHRGGRVIKLHVGGYPRLKSNEVRTVLEEDEYVIRKEAARALGPSVLDIINQGRLPGGSQANIEVGVIVNNNNGSQVSTTQQPNGNGGVDLIVMIDEAVGNAVMSGRGKTYRAMQTMFGARPTLTRR